MTISLQKLQELFNQRSDLSIELTMVERRIRELVGEPTSSADSGVSENTQPRTRRRAPKAPAAAPETGSTNPSDWVTAIEADSSHADEPFAPSAVGVVILGAMNSGTTYSGAEIYQLTLDASSPDTDPVELKAAVKSEIRLLYTSGHLTKSGEGPATRYTKTC